jgi:hypothetical protein
MECLSAAFRGGRGGSCDDAVHAPSRPHQDQDAEFLFQSFGADYKLIGIRVPRWVGL